MLGFEVDKLAKDSIKTSNILKYIKSNIENTKALRINDPIISIN